MWHFWGLSETNFHSSSEKKRFFRQFAYTSLGFIRFFCNFFSQPLHHLLCLVLPFVCAQTYSHSLFLSLFSNKILKSIIVTNVHWSKNQLIAWLPLLSVETHKQTHIYAVIVLCSATVLCALNYSLSNKKLLKEIYILILKIQDAIHKQFSYTVLYCYILYISYRILCQSEFIQVFI